MRSVGKQALDKSGKDPVNGNGEEILPRRSGAMRSIELWGALRP
jgi:hypothetical protein